MESNLNVVRHYLRAIESGATGPSLGAYFDRSMVQEEFPNRIAPNGNRRDFFALLKAAERGREILASQSFEIISAVSSGESVALEVLWTGELAVPYGSVPAGKELRARCAMFFEFQNGKIIAQRNYDCFDPF